MDNKRNQNHSLEQWNRRLDLALKNLPERPAPADLFPQVMAKVQARKEEKQEKRPWRAWPQWLRVTTAALALLLMGYLSVLGFQLYETRVIPVFSQIAQAFLTTCASLSGICSELRETLGSKALHYVLLTVSLLLFGMYLTCLGLGTFIYRTVRR
jgi:hypothetical protein